MIFAIALCSDFLANSRPLILYLRGHVYFPIVVNYPETAFGGDFLTEADYRDPYLQKLIHRSGGWMIWPPIRYSYDTVDAVPGTPAPAPPSPENWLGTDDRGRDVLARLLYGFRTSVLFGIVLTALSTVIGVVTGAVQGYFGGWVDLLGQRVVEIWVSVPHLYIVIIIATIMEPGFWMLLGVLMLFGWVGVVGFARAEVLRSRQLDYVRAARALGAGDGRILFSHVLPNAVVSTLTILPFQLNAAIVSLTMLDFLGFGLPANSPSLGELLRQGRDNLQAPWLALTSFATLAAMLTLLVFIGEAARDAFDPRKSPP